MSNKYKTKLMSLDRLLIGPDGPQMSLCESCRNKDCGNPIIDQDIAVFGIRRTAKLYQTAFEPKLVVSCEGYIPEPK